MFCDVKMPGLDGLDLARVLARFAQPPHVVFVTGLRRARAGRLRPAGHRLPAQAGAARSGSPRRCGGWSQARGDRAAAGRGARARRRDDRRGAGRRHPVRAAQRVRYVEAQGDYARLHTAVEQPPGADPADHARGALGRNAGFVRIHRSTLVALPHVDEIRIDGGRCCVRLGDRSLQVSRRHTRELRDRLVRAASLSAGDARPPAGPGHQPADDGADRDRRRAPAPATSPSRPASARSTPARCCGRSCGSGSPPWSRDRARARRAARAVRARTAARHDPGGHGAAALADRSASPSTRCSSPSAGGTCGRASGPSATSPTSSSGGSRARRRWWSPRAAAAGPPCSRSSLVCVATIGVGALGLRLSRTTSDFYVASRVVTPRWNASAIGGEYLSAASFLGIAGLVLAFGVDVLWYPVGLHRRVPRAARPRRRAAAALGRLHPARLRPAAAGSRRRPPAVALLVVGIGWLYLLPQFQGAGLALRTVTGAPQWVGAARRRRASSCSTWSPAACARSPSCRPSSTGSS